MIVWDRENIEDLKAALDSLSEDDRWQVDMSDLPTEPISSDIAGYPVWAMDKNGMCLVGESADQIEHISEVSG